MSTPTDPVKVITKRRPHSPRFVISTTEEIIERAIPKDSGHCVWADAVAQAYPTAKSISVDLATIRFTDPKKGHRYTYLTPRTVQVDLVNFDQGIKPHPQSVQLRGAMVTKAGSPKKATKPGRGNHPLPVPARAELVRPVDGSGQGQSVPDRVGGKPPPLAAYGHRGGMRREFGLRGLGRPTKVEEKSA